MRRNSISLTSRLRIKFGDESPERRPFTDPSSPLFRFCMCVVLRCMCVVFALHFNRAPRLGDPLDVEGDFLSRLAT